MSIRMALLMFFLVLAGCSDEGSKERGQFISGCVQSGVSKSICICTWDKIEEKYTPKELKKINTPGKAPPEGFMRDVVTAAQHCQ